jgi:hypothetical protein
VDQDFISGLYLPTGLAVDAQHIYWGTAADAIGEAGIDGTGIDQTFITGGSYSESVAVNSQHIYWSNDLGPQGSVGSANLDGTGVNPRLISTQASEARGVALDGQYVYWANTYSGVIGRANLDGTAAVPTLIGDAFAPGLSLGAPIGVVVDSGPPGSAITSAPSLTFGGTEPLGTLTAQQQLTVTNSGHGDLQIDQAQIAGANRDDFLTTFDSCSGATLPVRGACIVGVSFAPNATGARTATLTVTSNDPAGPSHVALTGTGGKVSQGLSTSTRIDLVICKTVKAKSRGPNAMQNPKAAEVFIQSVQHYR